MTLKDRAKLLESEQLLPSSMRGSRKASSSRARRRSHRGRASRQTRCNNPGFCTTEKSHQCTDTHCMSFRNTTVKMTKDFKRISVWQFVMSPAAHDLILTVVDVYSSVLWSPILSAPTVLPSSCFSYQQILVTQCSTAHPHLPLLLFWVSAADSSECLGCFRLSVCEIQKQRQDHCVINCSEI